jgi:PIN domain nuclease of toxin-antitoxin system
MSGLPLAAAPLLSQPAQRGRDVVSLRGFQELPVSARHAAAVAKLPLHHTDPFDRLLLAQAFLEPRSATDGATQRRRFA